ncbi:hydrolase Nlp/P60 [Streptomyces armeniacus]|uniref:Hydrolase Nlp/P60 n=1 Tax=Streptomyces armeniacus TaxID=83291 RepID=A0A345XYS5_9ACTN|nr:bifunctional lytic transglycosylase/C40 family peptidase [Streptomyces armeniacus]AXK36791.1 hydrolase Nlp/P60 [Streptomyces armeniacus]
MSTFARIGTGLGCSLVALTLLSAVLATGLPPDLTSTAGGTEAPSRHARKDIPGPYLALYRRAEPECPGLSWTVLAAIGKVETDHGRHPTMRSPAGALGPMQFLPSTFREYAHPVPPGGKKPATPWDPVDAVFAAARLLCANGAKHGKNLERAIWHYNHADWYVRKVLRIADSYTTTQPASGAAETALAFARSQLGTRYVWGGNGAKDGGFDCSGLTKAAYQAAGINLPRTAEAQYDATVEVPRGQPLKPGDLLFYGRPGNLHHVGLYAGKGRMIHAPRPGTRIRYEAHRYRGHDFYAATRPTARSHR